MVTVAGGPVSSGGIKLEKLNRRDCSDIKVAVAALNIQLNAVVKRCCAELDDQEGRGFLGADLLGIELIRGGAAPTEGHQIGLQIDNLLAETKPTEGKLRQAVRTRKSIVSTSGAAGCALHHGALHQDGHGYGGAKQVNHQVYKLDNAR